MIFGLTLVHIPSVSSMIFDEETENDRLACLELLALVLVLFLPSLICCFCRFSLLLHVVFLSFLTTLLVKLTFSYI